MHGARNAVRPKLTITETQHSIQPDGFEIRQPRREKDKRLGIKDKLNIVTWNVRGLGMKEMELQKILKEKHTHIAVITETKKKLKGTKELNDYTMIYSGVPQNIRAKCGVAILVDNKWKTRIEYYTYVNERIITVRLKVDRGHLTIIGVYAPEEGKKQETEQFYEQLQETIEKVNKNDYMVICGDFNARIGNTPIPKIMGPNGEKCLNKNGQQLIQFASMNNFKITNTFFRKLDINKYTWSARGLRSIIDYVIINDKLRSQVIDVHVYRGCDINSDHYLVMAKLVLYSKWKEMKSKPRSHNTEVFKVYLLRDESIRNLYQQRLQQYLLSNLNGQNIEEEWQIIKNCIEKAAQEAIGRKNKFRSKKGLRIWNPEIENAIKEKQKAYKQWLQQKNEESKQIYKEKRNQAKTIVRNAHQNSWEKFISEIEDDIHGRQDFAYKVIKQLNKTEKDVARLNIIGKDRWIKHYKELWLEETESETDINNEKTEMQEIDGITFEELKEAIEHTKNRKATGPDGINMELLKYGGNALHGRLLQLINKCWRTRMIPESWKIAEVISLFKKGNREDCRNYRGISLLNAIYKIYTRIVNKRLRIITEVLMEEEQNGFRPGRSTIDNVFIMQQMFEKRKEFNLETHVAFIDFEKAFDRVNRKKLWFIMKEQGYPQHLIDVVKNMYINSKIIINTGDDRTEEIIVNKGVRQGCSMSPTLFNIYMNDIIQKWKLIINPGIKINRERKINILLYADDVVLIQKTENDLQYSLHILNQIAKNYNFKISKSKTKIMAFLGKMQIRSKIIIDEQPLEQVSNYKYLGCEMSVYSGNLKDIDTKLSRFKMICSTIHKTLRNKTRKETRMKFYKTMAVPTLLYGSEVWVSSNSTKRKIQSAEMYFLRRTKGCTLMDKVKNEEIRTELQTVSINEQIESYRNNWLYHVDRMSNSRLPKLLYQYRPIGRRDVGRPKKRWRDML